VICVNCTKLVDINKVYNKDILECDKRLHRMKY